MADMTPWVVSGFTTLGAIIAGFWTYRASRAQAQPNAQDAINEGFTRLSERQDHEMEKLSARLTKTEKAAETARSEADTAKRQAETAKRMAEGEQTRLSLAVANLRSAQQWHIRHAATFDKPVIQALEEVAPDLAVSLVDRIEADPFPKLPDEL